MAFPQCFPPSRAKYFARCCTDRRRAGRRAARRTANAFRKAGRKAAPRAQTIILYRIPQKACRPKTQDGAPRGFPSICERPPVLCFTVVPFIYITNIGFCLQNTSCQRAATPEKFIYFLKKAARGQKNAKKSLTFRSLSDIIINALNIVHLRRYSSVG